MVVDALANGYDVSAIPEPARSDGMAVFEAIKSMGLTIVSTEMFLVTIHDDLPEPCAGTTDLILRSRSGRYFIGDFIGNFDNLFLRAIDISGEDGGLVLATVLFLGMFAVITPACQPRSGSTSRNAIRATSHGIAAPISRNGRRKANVLPGAHASPIRASHAVIPGRSEYAQARWRPSCQ